MSGTTIPDELIGKQVVAYYKFKNTDVYFEGKIVDETQNIITIQNQNQIKKLIKNQYDFLIEINDKKIQVDGNDLVSRPEERIKKWLKRKK
jgi:RNase P/RNase MRP subunit p29